MLCDKRLCGGRADAGEKLRTATDVSATISILHGCDYVSRTELFGASRGTDQRGDLA